MDLLEQVFAYHEIGTIPESHVLALQRLRRTHQLGVVSNIWSKSDLYLKEFERVGISNLFETIVFSSDHGCIKPSPFLFAKAIGAFDASGAKTVFVGDSLKRDVAGAKAAGLEAIWIDSSDEQAVATVASLDLVITDLCDLVR